MGKTLILKRKKPLATTNGKTLILKKKPPYKPNPRGRYV